MRLIIIPPYLNPATEGQFMPRELLANMEKKGQLKGVDVDIDDGYPTEYTAATRDEEFLAIIAVGVIKKVKEYSEMGKYDAIVLQGAIEPGFFAARTVSAIPVAGVVHSSVHMASLIGDRFVILNPSDPGALIIRHYVQNYGLSDKLASVRHVFHSSTYMMGFARKYKKEERIKIPEVKKIVEDITTQCIAAIEKDRADTLILGCPPLQIFEDEIRRGLDESGYSEIQLVCSLSAAVEMAKAMVNTKLTQAPRAYPRETLKAKPEFR